MRALLISLAIAGAYGFLRGFVSAWWRDHHRGDR